MAHYLVTGGCGFIGSHLVDRLINDGHRVTVLDDLSTGRLENLAPGAHLVRGSVADQVSVRAAAEGVDGIYHLAAIASVERSVEDWAGTHRVNLGGTVNVLDAARDHGRGHAVPVVYASSAAVYGDNASTPLAESSQARPLSPYGADKFGGELHARVAALVHGVPSAGFRFFNVYGPRQDPASPYSGVISIFAQRILDGQQVVVHGDGRQVRDFVYVADVVDFLVTGMDEAEGAQVFNVCTGRPTSILQLAQALAALDERRLEVEYQPARSGDIRTSLGDPRLARRVLRRVASRELADGLRATLHHLSGTRRAA